MMPDYSVYALKYATHDRRASANFIHGDAPDAHMPMDYYVWLIRGAGQTYVVDTGFNQAAADARGRQLLRCPVESLDLLGVQAAAVRDVIITHLHYDHAGNLDLFPQAKFHLQDREMQFATGRYMCHRCISDAFNLQDVLEMVRQVYAGRVAFHDGDVTLAPGISLHRIGGHTYGLQAVRVHTRRGWVVLASDASHYYANMTRGLPFPIVADVGEMAEGWRRLHELADSPDHIIPGHDPEVLNRYPSAGPGLDGIAAALHEPGSGGAAATDTAR